MWRECYAFFSSLSTCSAQNPSPARRPVGNSAIPDDPTPIQPYYPSRTIGRSLRRTRPDSSVICVALRQEGTARHYTTGALWRQASLPAVEGGTCRPELRSNPLAWLGLCTMVPPGRMPGSTACPRHGRKSASVSGLISLSSSLPWYPQKFRLARTLSLPQGAVPAVLERMAPRTTTNG